MKELFRFKALYLIAALVWLTGCKDNLADGPPPVGESISEQIITSPGTQINFAGTFTDESGFSKITLASEELLLDKTIVFANHVKKYFLDYKFLIPSTAESKVYDITITAENLNGKTESFVSKVDVATNPESSNMVSNIKAAPGDEIAITGTINDKQGISKIEILSATLGLSESITPGSNPTLYELDYKFIIPAAAERVVHKALVTITNVRNRTTSYNVTVNLTGEAVVYENIYIAGSFQWWAWKPNLGFPMTQDPNNPEWFETQVHVWDTYDELKFIGQLDWQPNNWGLVDQNDPSKGMLNDNSSAPVKLAANGANPAYYNLRFNPYQMKYEANQLTEVIQGIPELYIVGKGFPDYPQLDWNPDAAIKMTKNPYDFGEHIFIIEGLKFSDAVDLKFIGQNSGWGPYDAGFVTGGEVQAPVSWAKIKEGDGSADLKFKNQAGSYTVLFDYYLKRACIWKEE